MKGKKRPNIALYAASVLLCLVLISAHFTAGLYARFTARAAGADSAGTAVFRVSAQGEQESMELVAGKTQENTVVYSISVKNDSDTPASYSVTLTFDDTVTDRQISRILLGELEQPFASEVTFENVGTLAPHSPQVDRDLLLDFSPAFRLEDQAGLDFSNDTVNGSSGECPFTVTVQFRQIN